MERIHYKPIMTSRQIADKAGRLHENVLQDTRNMLRELGKDFSEYESIYIDAEGKVQSMFVLDVPLALTLLTGYDTRTRYELVCDAYEAGEKQARRAAFLRGDITGQP